MPDQGINPQLQIQHDLEHAVMEYADLWRRITGEWRASSTGNQVWLSYSANYLVSSSGYKWALDPFAMSARVANLPAPDYQADLAPLSLVLLTHEHNDHLDMALFKALSDLEIQWVIPGYLQGKIVREAALPSHRVITPVPGEWITTGPLRVLPFESLHMRVSHGVPETGYLVEHENMRWLFPGDIRNFDITRLHDFGRLDAAVAHIWLGKAHALDECPPLLNDFCEFFTWFQTERLIITHMNEFGRNETELWRKEHYELAKSEILRRRPGMRVEKALMGDRFDLG
jgi:L-ascorbate metabolism protein UlaG (beta-lactamase superfamily)